MSQEEKQEIPQVKTVKREEEPIIDKLQPRPKKSKLREALKRFNKLDVSKKFIIVIGGFSIGAFILVGIGSQIQKIQIRTSSPPTPTPIPTIPLDRPTSRPTRPKTQTELHLDYIRSADFEKTGLLPPQLDLQIVI